MTEDPTRPSHSTDNPPPERRASDVVRLKFGESAFKGTTAAPIDMATAEIETINMDAVLPPGSDDFRVASPGEKSMPRLSAEQNRGRLAIVKFKQSFDSYASTSTTGIGINQIKRGDVIEIRTLVGSLFIRVVDRLRAERQGIGEILGECRYDLLDQWHLVHIASITLPVFAKTHRWVNPDGSSRQASRALKMTTDAELPDHVRNLLHETFFSEIVVYANPQPEKLRPVDVWRWFKRGALWLKVVIDENNRREREKEERRKQAAREKQEEKARRKEEKARQRNSTSD